MLRSIFWGGGGWNPQHSRRKYFNAYQTSYHCKYLILESKKNWSYYCLAYGGVLTASGLDDCSGLGGDQPSAKLSSWRGWRPTDDAEERRYVVTKSPKSTSPWTSVPTRLLANESASLSGRSQNRFILLLQCNTIVNCFV